MTSQNPRKYYFVLRINFRQRKNISRFKVNSEAFCVVYQLNYCREFLSTGKLLATWKAHPLKTGLDILKHYLFGKFQLKLISDISKPRSLCFTRYILKFTKLSEPFFRQYTLSLEK